MHIRIVPIRLRDGGLEVVDHDRLRNPTQIPEGVLQAAQEALGRLVVHRLAVRLTRETQHDTKDMGPFPGALRRNNRGAGPEVHLALLAGTHFHPPKRNRLTLVQPVGKATHATVPGVKALLRHQVLVDPLAGQPLLEILFNHLPERLTAALRAGTFCHRGPRGDLRPGGRVRGWFCRRRRRMDVASHGLPVDPQFLRDPPLGPAQPMQRQNRIYRSHLELVCHTGPPEIATLSISGCLYRKPPSPQSGWF
jgi:hypothetical protein